MGLPSTASQSFLGGFQEGRQVEAMESASSLSRPSADGVYEIGGLFPVWAVVVIDLIDNCPNKGDISTDKKIVHFQRCDLC